MDYPKRTCWLEDFPVVTEKEISNPAKPLDGLSVLDCDGFVGVVATRHNQGARVLLQQKVMQGRVRQHESQEPVSRGNPLGKIIPLRLKKDYRSRGVLQDVLFLF